MDGRPCMEESGEEKKNNVTRRPSNLYERVILVQGQC
jgi:hypothetical protein